MLVHFCGNCVHAGEARGVAAHVGHGGRRPGRHGDAVLSQDVRRHPLANRGLVVGIREKSQIAVDVGVDEPGSNDLAGSVDPQRSFGVHLPDGHDAIAAKADIGAEPGKPLPSTT